MAFIYYEHLVNSFILIGVVLHPCLGMNSDPYKNLHTALLQNYTNELVPRCVKDGNLTVSVGSALREIMDLNEVDQTIKIKLWIRLRWTDCYLLWDTSNYDGVSSMTLKSTSVWRPDITLFESVNKGITLPGEDDFRVFVSNDGSVSYNFPSVVMSSCSIDVTYFPYDTQNCSLTLASWSESGLVMDVIQNGDTGDLKAFVTNIEWEVLSMDSVRHVQYYGCCPDPFPDVTFYLVIRRKPQFYFLTLIFPMVLLLALAALGFLLPAESGEKMSLQITVLLSLSVFLLIVTEKLPASAENFPIIGVYFSVSMILVSLSCLLTALVLYMYFRNESTKRVPLAIRKCCLLPWRNFPSFSCFHRKMVVQDGKEKRDNITMTEIEDISNIGEEVKKVNIGKEAKPETMSETPRNIVQEWQDLARLTDKIILFVYILTSVLTTTCFLLALVFQR